MKNKALPALVLLLGLSLSCAQERKTPGDVEAVKEAEVFTLDSPEVRELSSISGRFANAFEFLQQNDPVSLASGIYELDGKNLYVNVQNVSLKDSCDAKLEVHDKYFDIQVPVSKAEKFGIMKRADLMMPESDMDTINDIRFFLDRFTEIRDVNPGEIIVLSPDIAHAPCIGTGDQKKIVIKVKVD